jgi:TRAP-type C4-dicarboxylate transport system permease small subunit
VERLLRWIEVPIHVLTWLAMAAGLCMMLHVTADVVGRSFFNHPLPGTTEIVSAYYMVAAAYLPWAYIARGDGHIMVELFTHRAPARVNAVLDAFVHLLTIAYLLVFTWQTGLRAVEQYYAKEVWEAAALYIPVWPSRWLLPLAGGLMALYLLLRVMRDMARLLRR